MIRIVAIADSHGSHDELKMPDGDILVVAGDFCGLGDMDDVINFNKWLRTLPHRRKIIVPGNHDLICPANKELVKQMFGDAIYLDMEGAQVMNLRFFGSPWTPRFYSWAYMYPRNSGQAKDIYAQVPSNTDILITHGPAHGTKLGWVPDGHNGGEDAGCEVLRQRIEALQGLKAHICGHIHCGGHQTDMVGKVPSYNVSVMNEEYWVTNPPTVIDIEGDPLAPELI